MDYQEPHELEPRDAPPGYVWKASRAVIDIPKSKTERDALRLQGYVSAGDGKLQSPDFYDLVLDWDEAERYITERQATDEETARQLWPNGAAAHEIITEMYEGVEYASPNGIGPTAPQPEELEELHRRIRAFQTDEDEDATLFALAVGVSAGAADGDPLWGMIVGAPSGGKTERISLVPADKAVKDITVAGLLTCTAKGKAYGTLIELQDRKDAVLTISDFSALLGEHSGEARVNVFNALRDVYDGHYVRRLATGAPEWRGKLTLLAACTSAIDHYSSHADSLGPRWIYFRLRERESKSRRKIATFAAQRQALADKRKSARQYAATVIRQARSRLPSVVLSQETYAVIEVCAEVIAQGRAGVPRESFGRREIIGKAEIEEPGRAASQLALLATSLFALGLDAEHVHRILRRAAMSTMPGIRASVLRYLTEQTETVTTKGVADGTGMNRAAARRALEDLEAIGLVVNEPSVVGGVNVSETDDERESRKWNRWTLAPEVADLIREVGK